MASANPRPVDPFLWAHWLRGHIFDISTGLRPSSIRDQITRGRLLIRRAWDTHIIEPGSLIVISGVGVAGAVCALEALKYGIRVLLVEQKRFLFGVQRFCVTRFVDPHLYDWPAEHWRWMTYPLPGDGVELKFTVYEQPRRIAQRWTDYLREVSLAAPDLLEIRLNSAISTPPADLDENRTHTVTFEDGSTLTAAMVVIAEGPGQERDTLPKQRSQDFHGYRFWDTDPFARSPIRAERILIVGSGDGALQDFLRIILKPEVTLRRLLQKCDVPEEYLARISACHQHNTAAFLWCATQQHEHHNDQFAHRRHEAALNEIFMQMLSRTSRRLLRAVRESLRTDVPEVVLAHACDHFTHGYPANRFLTLLVQRALREFGDTKIAIRANTLVTSIDCNHPQPTLGRTRPRLRKYCYAQPHTVWFAEKTSTFTETRCFDRIPERSSSDRREQFDAIILRIGTEDKLDPRFTRDREKPLRQLLPAHLAHER